MRPARAWLLGSVLAVGACGEKPASEPADPVPVHAHHSHRAPHGGSLQVIGDEFAHVELVLDAAAGRLTAYVLDGEAEKAIRVPERALQLNLGGDTIELAAVASELTGEAAGDTSQFEAASGALRARPSFRGTLGPITVRGARFDAIRVAHPEGSEESDHAGR